jgi:hypothetical protein
MPHDVYGNAHDLMQNALHQDSVFKGEKREK